MSEARAVTNFTGNAVATILVGTWTKQIDMGQVARVLSRNAPFDETTMNADAHAPAPTAQAPASAEVTGS
jgi:aerobic C4-dicarboxylate transport protein